MTDDLGPGETISDDLTEVFAAYLVAAAGHARDRGSDAAADLLAVAGAQDARFSDLPVTSAEGRSLASVDLVLDVPAEHAPRATPAVLDEMATLITEVVQGDGYSVRQVRLAG